jgi:septal ring factor EnvC (AmiA/AmiB activator)
MKTFNKKNILITLIAITLLVATNPYLTKAVSFNYADGFLDYFKVAATPDIAKPGDIVTVNITSRIAISTQSTIFHIKIYIDTTTQTPAIQAEADLGLPINSVSNTYLTQIIIPTGARNNTYLYLNATDGVRTFSKIPLALIQNPPYATLEINLSTLQSQIANLTTQLNTIQTANSGLQTQINALQNERTTLQNQIAQLQSNGSTSQNLITQLQTANSALQTRINELDSENSALKSQITTFQQNSAILQTDKESLTTQLNNSQTQNSEFQLQISSLQTQVNSLQLNNTNLQSILNALNIQTATLQTQINELESQNSTTNILMYLAIFVAVLFIIVTAFIITLIFKKKNTKSSITQEKQSNQANSVEQV